MRFCLWQANIPEFLNDFVKYSLHIEGDYYNVIGLPIDHLQSELKKIEGE